MSFEDYMSDGGFDNPHDYMDYLEGRADDIIDEFYPDDDEEEKDETSVFYHDRLASIDLKSRGVINARFIPRITTDSVGRTIIAIIVSGFNTKTNTGYEDVVFPGFYANDDDLRYLPEGFDDIIYCIAENKICFACDQPRRSFSAYDNLIDRRKWHLVSEKRPVWKYIISNESLIHLSGKPTDDYCEYPWIRDPYSEYSTIATDEDYLHSFKDSQRVVYSKDKKLLLNGEAPFPQSNNPSFRLINPDLPILRTLQTYQIAEGTTYICDYAFCSFRQLKDIVFPDSLLCIGEEAFANCGSLSSIILPKSVKRIGRNAFDSCYSLKTIKILNPDIIINNDSFEKRYIDFIYVPIGTQDKFAAIFGDKVIEIEG